MSNSDLTESISNKWSVILSDLEKVSRVAWLAYSDSYPITIENNILIVGILESSKIIMASEDKHKENLKKIILSETNVNLSIEIQLLKDDKIIRKIKDKKLFSTEEIAPKPIVETNQNKIYTKNPFITRFMAKRWQWIVGLLFLLYFIFLFLDSRFEFVPESSNVPQQINEFECKTYTDNNGEFIDPCGDNFIPEENPGYQGR
jgi:hypothetical protein